MPSNGQRPALPTDRHGELAFDAFLDALIQRTPRGEDTNRQDIDPALTATARRFHALADRPDASTPPASVLASIREEIMSETIVPVTTPRPSPHLSAAQHPVGWAAQPLHDAARRTRRPVAELSLAAVVLLALFLGSLAYRLGPGSPSGDDPSLPGIAPGGTGELFGSAIPTTPDAIASLLATCPMPNATEIPGSAAYFTEWGLGESPVWLVGWGIPPAPYQDDYPGPYASYLTPAFAGESARGWPINAWPIRALWAHNGTATGPFFLSGSRLGDGAPVWFETPGEESGPTSALSTGLSDFPVRQGDFRTWPSDLFFPGTGCYELTAEWGNDRWSIQVPFVAPESEFVAPDPADCTVPPRDAASLRTIAATPGDIRTPPSSGLDIREPIEPANPSTVAAVTATVREVFACLNAGDKLRTAALYTDDALHPRLAEDPLMLDEALAVRGPRAAYRIEVVGVQSDGRAVAEIAFREAETIFTVSWIFARQGDRYLVDLVVPLDSAPATLTPTSTPFDRDLIVVEPELNTPTPIPTPFDIDVVDCQAAPAGSLGCELPPTVFVESEPNTPTPTSTPITAEGEVQIIPPVATVQSLPPTFAVESTPLVVFDRSRPSTTTGPEAAACQMAARTVQELLILAATPMATAVATAPPDAFDDLASDSAIPAGTATVAEITRTVHEIYACFEAGDELRAYALFTDDALRPFLAGEPLLSEQLYQGYGMREPLGVEEARFLPDGRVIAQITFRVSEGVFTETWIFVHQNGRYRVDAVLFPDPDDSDAQRS